MDRRDTKAEEGEGGEFQLAWVDKSLDNINVLSVFLYFLVRSSFSSPLSFFFLVYAFESPFCIDNIHNTIHIICSDSCGTLHIWYAYWFNFSPQELQLYVLINHSLDSYLFFLSVLSIASLRYFSRQEDYLRWS